MCSPRHHVRLPACRWVVVPPADRFKLQSLDAQVWLALNGLLTEPACRAKYRWDQWRRERLGSLKRHLNELLLDQLPPLTVRAMRYDQEE